MGHCKCGSHLPCVHRRQAICTLPECPLALPEEVCRVGLLIRSYKDEILYRAAVIRVMQCTVVIVMKVYAVPCNESTQP
jgi:hypothetical protein